MNKRITEKEFDAENVIRESIEDSISKSYVLRIKMSIIDNLWNQIYDYLKVNPKYIKNQYNKITYDENTK
ncbi:MAG: hypothetical protein ACOC33_04105 [bacterium]